MKLRRLTALIVVLSICLSMLSINAYAGENEEDKGVSDSISLNAVAARLAAENDNVERVKYGESVQGRSLEAFVVTNEQSQVSAKKTKTLLMTFAIHGFEDEYYRDGKKLVEEANAIIEYFAENSSELCDYRLVIVPCANPDGTIAGKNNKRSGTNAFGRCTSKHIDMNRDFGSFKALETRKLRDFIRDCRLTVYLDVHGWLNEAIGNATLNKIVCDSLGLGMTIDNYPTQEGYAIDWVNKNLKIPSTLVEYASSESISTDNDIAMIKKIIATDIDRLNQAETTFPNPVKWKNGSTTENVYKQSNLSNKLAKLPAKKNAYCYRKCGNGYLIVYCVGNSYYKAGFVKYSGGVKSAPTKSRTYKNGSTPESVYADTARKKKIGSLDPKEKCKCLGKKDGMYLVVYNVGSTSTKKCGFVAYNGAC